MKMENLQFLAHSLQSTSRVLSAKALHQQAMVQEAAIQLVGLAILSGVEIQLIDDLPLAAGELPKMMARQAPSQVLQALEMAVWVGRSSGHAVLAKSVASADEWEELPIHLQNFVAEKHFPCHLLVLIEQMTLEGDAQHRHYAEPIFVRLQRRPDGRLESGVAFGTAELRKTDPDQAVREALAHIQPFMSIVFAAIMQPAQGEAA